MKLKIMSWNATGIMTSIPYLLNELKNKNINICGVSEHWLLNHNAYILETINTEFHAHVITCSNPKSLNGRLYGKGGVALMWHKSLSSVMEPIETYSDRLAAIKINCSSFNVNVIQVYLPCANESIDCFKSKVDKLSDLLSTLSSTDHTVLMGDFNCKLNDKGQSRAGTRVNYLNKLLKSVNLKLITGTDVCKGPGYSFDPGAAGLPSLIDHLMVGESLMSTINNCYFENDSPINVSRHLPLFVELNIVDVSAKSYINAEKFTKECFNWSSDAQKQHYILTEVTNFIPKTAFNFKNIDLTYAKLVSGLQSAAEKCVRKRSFKRYLKPFWSTILENLHKSMTQTRNLWIISGRPRYGIEYFNYKENKRIFRHKMRLAANEYEINEYERIDKLAEVDQKGFWKIMNSKRSKKQNLNSTNEMKFNDVMEKDPDKILNGWCEYFRNLYSFSNDNNFDDDFRITVENDVSGYLESSDINCTSHHLTNAVTYGELASIISSLPNEKSASSDNLTYEHIKYGGKALTECLVQLFNMIIKEEKVPKAFKERITVTLHKGSGKSKTDPNNYRAISLLPVIFKLFEKMLLTRLEKIKFQ